MRGSLIVETFNNLSWSVLRVISDRFTQVIATLKVNHPTENLSCIKCLS
ncbi:MAG: hypothetical protein RMX68_011050 [Aulosira sp. ZfuVER01]|nr:hypothetical protein [Aulosira sp. DedVER01a]